jgi:hypothetical protein
MMMILMKGMPLVRCFKINFSKGYFTKATLHKMNLGNQNSLFFNLNSLNKIDFWVKFTLLLEVLRVFQFEP